MFVYDPAISRSQKPVLHKNNGLLGYHLPNNIIGVKLTGVLRLKPKNVEQVSIGCLHGVTLHDETVLLYNLLRGFKIIRQIWNRLVRVDHQDIVRGRLFLDVLD